jgi:hypothetical protein
MDGAFALASVTAALKNLLQNGLIAQKVTAQIGGEIPVSALPPDRIDVGADERAQLNLFLWQVTPNIGLPAAMKTRVRAGDKSRSISALALDLHYLLSAYSARDLEAEIVLGYAIQLLHQVSQKEDALRAALNSLSSNGDGANVPTAIVQASKVLAAQLEQLALSPQFLGVEEVAKIWSATQAHFRPSAVYKVSLVLIDADIE